MSVDSMVKHYKGISLIMVLILSFIFLVVCQLQLPAMADLAENNQTELELLKSSWNKGEVIAVVRHLERCDRVDVPCLNSEEGITKRSLGVGYALAEDFQILGLDKANIYYSPLQRTAETSQVLFGDEGIAEEKLYQCKEDKQLLNAAMGYKQAEKNLIFVTHSTCIDEFEQDLGFMSDTPEYATTLFAVRRSFGSKARLLGFVDAEDWELAFGW